MKTFRNIILFLTFFALAACEPEKVNPILDASGIFSVSPIAIVPPADGGTFTLNITGQTPWKIEIEECNTKDDSWCTFSTTSGDGAGTIELTVSPATSFVKNRTIRLAVKAEDGRILNAIIKQDTMVLGEDEVLVNGQVWSTKNVGEPGTFVDEVDQIGMYYQFNRKTGWPSVGIEAPEGWDFDYKNDGTDWTKENDPCPEGWRVPTTAEMSALWNIGATWVTAAQTGYSTDGIIVGISAEKAATATKETLKSLGGLFLPKSGWRNEAGTLDRDWLVAVRSGTSLSASHGGMSLGDAGGYRDVMGWGDGQKARAGMIRPVKDIVVED